MKIGFIGAGNMGGAIIKGLRNADPAAIIYVYTPHPEKLEQLKEEYGVIPQKTIADLAHKSDNIVLAVKPNKIDEVLAEVKEALGDKATEKLYISIAAAITISHMQGIVGGDAKIIRIMPNTPVLVNEGMSSISPGQGVSDEELKLVKDVFDGVGKTVVVPEDMIHAVISVSGSSPAYTYMYINALIENGVKQGITEESAKELAVQAVRGAAKMVLETGVDPLILRDNVCSKGGTTIEAVHVLEDEDFMGIVDKAADATSNRSKELTV
ncbi:MAG: pyrroline-5-carboxylate reductase [Clostridiales Family XIII bacterium]|jgi:pyrroline-5-carboxylate reductase|nr:pyrroline-5-carboxylate reductase [Clostridiales Family XIII bacterium]